MNCSGKTLVALLGLSLTSCVTVEGQSAAEIKRELQETFLYKSATAFSDGSAAGPFDARQRLSEPQKRYIAGEYQKIANALLETYRKHRAPLAQAFPQMAQSTLSPRISMPDGGNDAPTISPDGQIFIDIHIARLMFRDAVLASMRTHGLGSAGFMSNSDKCTTKAPDAVLLGCFLDMKARIDRIENQSLLGTLFDKRTWDLDEDAPWFTAADLKMKSVDLQNRYTGVLLFVTAHELGHVVLGHLDAQRTKRFVSGEDRRNAERQADDFAVTLLALATPALSFFRGDGLSSVATGYEGFFQNTYKNAGWSEDSTTHPSSAERLERARKLNAAIRDRQSEEIFTVLGERIGSQ